MESDPLQQLRDVHLPGDPSWWPPAVGWWLAALILIGAVVWLSLHAWRAWRARAPLRRAEALRQSLLADARSQTLPAEAYAHAINELIKRVLVVAYGRRDLARLSGDAWLAALDGLVEAPLFSRGGARALGSTRFQARPEIDVDAIDEAVQTLFTRLRPSRLMAGGTA